MKLLYYTFTFSSVTALGDIIRNTEILRNQISSGESQRFDLVPWHSTSLTHSRGTRELARHWMQRVKVPRRLHSCRELRIRLYKSERRLEYRNAYSHKYESRSAEPLLAFEKFNIREIDVSRESSVKEGSREARRGVERILEEQRESSASAFTCVEWEPVGIELLSIPAEAERVFINRD